MIFLISTNFNRICLTSKFTVYLNIKRQFSKKKLIIKNLQNRKNVFCYLNFKKLNKCLLVLRYYNTFLYHKYIIQQKKVKMLKQKKMISFGKYNRQ